MFLECFKKKVLHQGVREEDKLVDLKLGCAIEAPEGKKLQTLCIYV